MVYKNRIEEDKWLAEGCLYRIIFGESIQHVNKLSEVELEQEL